MPANKGPRFRYNLNRHGLSHSHLATQFVAISCLTLWPTHVFVKMNIEGHETPHLEHFLSEYSTTDVGFRARGCGQGLRNLLHGPFALRSRTAGGLSRHWNYSGGCLRDDL